MSGKGVPLDAETETRLVDAMYRARTESKAPDLSGPAGMDKLAKEMQLMGLKMTGKMMHGGNKGAE
jgi:hypothetical protein